MDFPGDKPIYLQIAKIIMENILSETCKGGEKIPSVRELAVTSEVNPNTIMRTYSFLQDADIIINKRGIGYFIAEDALI